MTEDDPRRRLGSTIAGRYYLESVIGEGGMGIVYGGRQTSLDRPVAIKVMHISRSTSRDLVARFIQEARTAASFTHPNIVQVFDVGEESDGTVYLVLELLRGQSLAERLASGPMSAQEAVPVMVSVLAALEVAHNRGVVHRDIKPDNIFLATDDAGRVVPKILDFGIAKLVMGGYDVKTRTGMILGTPCYMSPEQSGATNYEVDGRADLWSVGVVLYECLSGVRPFDGNSPSEILVRIATVAPPLLNTLPQGVPQPVAVAVERSLKREREERWANAAAMASGLTAALSASASAAIAPTMMMPPTAAAASHVAYAPTQMAASQPNAFPGAAQHPAAVPPQAPQRQAASFAIPAKPPRPKSTWDHVVPLAVVLFVLIGLVLALIISGRW